MTNCKYYQVCGSAENCANCKGYQAGAKKIVYCIGAKWFDKVNGNTYCNTKVIDGENINYLGFEYGYGSFYYYKATDYFDGKYGAGNYKLIDLGAFYLKKADVKNGCF